MSRLVIYKFILYVAGDGLNSSSARANLAELCRDYLPDRHQIDIVDVFKDPKRALADRIFLTPTLVILEPLPARAIVGSLNNQKVVLQALGLGPLAA